MSIDESAVCSRRRWLPFGSAGLKYRLGVASRALAAVAGGYAVSAMAGTVIALYLPASRAEATLTGMLLSFAVYTCAVMWVFAARTAWKAWLGLLLPAAVLGAMLLFHFHAGGGT